MRIFFGGEGGLLSVGEYFKAKYSFPPPAWLA